MGLSRLAASIDPSALPAPRAVWISSMKRIMPTSDSFTSFRTALRRSSNSPRYFAPATLWNKETVKALWDVATDDALSEALDDSGLADARFADQHRVILGATSEDADDAANLVVAADDRIEFAGLGLGGLKWDGEKKKADYKSVVVYM
ncbi:hypothetical protein BC936DRAFT_139965 [Jimgerdemannia flammicorona]|uniref:Uncharacterized protein n=1 Tax=Jimgerdemannia flammicorona TaxID=994334 RepID=A0A433DH98_9FUNG|nr:hypothetical protein BC936DRAFT_139965 [Jimgerdemannia flammicorona]